MGDKCLDGYKTQNMVKLMSQEQQLKTSLMAVIFCTMKL